MSALALPPVQHVDVAGVRLAYRLWGETGEPLLLIHGITSSSLSWARVAPALARRYRVIAVDNKGHGDSAQPESAYTLEAQAAEAEALLAYLGIERAPVVGHSWGGAIGLLLATRSDRVSRLVLEDPALHVSDENRAQYGEYYTQWVGLTAAEAEAKVRATYPQWTEDDVSWKVDAATKGSRAAVRSVFENNSPWDVRPFLSGLHVPTLLVRAEISLGGIVGPRTAAQAEAAGVKVVTVPGADHSIHRSSFAEFMAIVEPFLAG